MALYKPLLTALLVFGAAAAARAQSSDNTTPVIPGFGRETPAPGSPEAELLHRAAIKREEEAHREMIERAKENTRLGAELAATAGRGADSDALKKLDRMEKLARKIRGNSGGSDDDEDVLQNPPPDLASALKMLAETADVLLKEVEKTSRHVTSATVISRSNEVIQLVRHAKSFVRR